jgi:hypothetical protein
MSAANEITAKLEQLGELMFARDMAIVDELWSDGFRLIGSEIGEIATTRADLETLFSGLFEHPARLRWRWDETVTTIENDIAWAFAEGNLELAYADHTDRKPYRLVTVFRRANDSWQWRLFSGSEPY